LPGSIFALLYFQIVQDAPTETGMQVWIAGFEDRPHGHSPYNLQQGEAFHLAQTTLCASA